ncbi:acyltransferase [Bradyrhizobium sp. CCGB12]|uniref:acyltransferase family protein n=1 Tax=Bradyrhizobium sp. CCGB12 TaxID=2949632 RepID=UPI0020B256AC|nr:acyltransferase family protein [Bradyrhizobium sp. CCGB12]MCP3392307.1 acyltransferase [Bradyrhizobium sp. CCGB12]
MVSNYRADIDGLRAVSVLLVFLFHYEVPAVSGGFVGVDVFFVISGYLITGILITSMKTQQFSLAWFYERRIRRILPALLSTVSVTLIVGWSLDGMWKWPCPEIAPIEVATFAGPARSSHLCALGAPWTTARDRALVWGDSNAEHLLPILNWTGLADNTAIGLVNPCPGIVENGKVERYWPDNPAYSSQCGRQRASVLELLRNRPEIGTVILSARWSDLPTMLYRGNSNVRSEAIGLRLLRDSLRDLLDEIGPSKKVILFVDIPKVPVGNPTACAMAGQALLRRPCPANLEALIWRYLTEVQQPAQDVVREASAGRPNVIVLDPGNALCADGRCRVWFNGEFLYRDPDHFRRNFSQSTNAALAERLGFLAALQPIGVK